MKIHKIIVFGLTASGKTTFARKLSNVFHIKIYHTDDFAYKKKWTVKSTKKEFAKKLNKILLKKEWIIEGVHSEWILSAIKKADLVIFLNPHKIIMVRRALKRSKLKRREKDTFKQKLKLIYWIFRWGPKWYRKFDKFSKQFIEINTDEEKQTLLKKLRINKK